MVAGLREMSGNPGAVERFHERTAERYAELLGHSKGVLMKAGQIFSMVDTGSIGTGEFSPYQKALARLQADAPAMHPQLAKEALRADLGRPVQALFAEFCDEPMAAAASIGQVHRAVLHDGRQVAVKIQYPHAAEAILADLSNTELLATFFRFVSASSGITMPDLRQATREIADRITEEIDYRHEAANMTAFSNLYRDHPFIRVPEVVGEASGGRVLTMTYLDGLDWAAAQHADQELKNQWAEVIHRFFNGSARHANLAHADPHPGNYRFGPDGQVGFVDFGCVTVLPERSRRKWVEVFRAAIERRKQDLRDLMAETGYFAADSTMTADEAYQWFAEFIDEWLVPQPATYTLDATHRTIRNLIDVRSPDHPGRRMSVPDGFALFPRSPSALPRYAPCWEPLSTPARSPMTWTGSPSRSPHWESSTSRGYADAAYLSDWSTMSTLKATTAARLPWNSDDPYPFYEQCRRDGDVVWDDTSQAWLILGYHTARQVLSDPGWTSDPRANPDTRAAIDPLGSEMVDRSMLLTDGANHRRLRDAVRDVFTPSFIAGLTDGVQTIAQNVIAYPAAGIPFDFMSEIALPLPLTVAAEWLGLDPDNADLLRTESPAIIRMLGALADSEEINAGAAAFTTLIAEFLPLAADRKAHPGEDLLSFIAADPALELDDVVITAILIAVAGHETTANLLGSALIRLLQPAADGSRIIDSIDPTDPAVLTELLRLDGPVQATARTATREQRLGGAVIAAGQQALVVIAAANRDPAVFADPDQFRLSRAGPAPLTFGYGAHYCLGAALARLETTVALRRILGRNPVLAGPANWRDTPAIRGPLNVPITSPW